MTLLPTLLQSEKIDAFIFPADSPYLLKTGAYVTAPLPEGLYDDNDTTAVALFKYENYALDGFIRTLAGQKRLKEFMRQLGDVSTSVPLND